MQRPRLSRLQIVACTVALTFSFQGKPALAESPQKSVTTTVEQLTEQTFGIVKFLNEAPREPAPFVQAVFEHVRNNGTGGFQTVPTDQAKGALTTREYEVKTEGDCTDTDWYVRAILVRAKERGILPKNTIIGTAVYTPTDHPTIGHVVTFVSFDGLTTLSTDSLATAVSGTLGGKPVIIIDPATETLGQVKYPGILTYVVTGEERTGLFFKEQADVAQRAGDEATARKLYEKAYEFLKNNADASREIREKLGTFSFNDGIETLQKQNLAKALEHMNKAREYNPKPLHRAFVLHIEGLVAATQTKDTTGAQAKFEQAKSIARGITGPDADKAQMIMQEAVTVTNDAQNNAAQECNAGIDALKAQRLSDALGHMQKAFEADKKPLYRAFILHIEGVQALQAQNWEGAQAAQKELEDSNAELTKVSGSDKEMGASLKQTNDAILEQIRQALSQ